MQNKHLFASSDASALMLSKSPKKGAVPQFKEGCFMGIPHPCKGAYVFS